MVGLLVKLVGALTLSFIYQFYYKMGDTYAYFYAGEAVYSTLFKQPDIAFKFLMGNYDTQIVQIIKDKQM